LIVECVTVNQHWNAAEYAEHARFVADLAADPLLDLLQPRRRERILDIGCGDGALTERLVGAGASVVGIDSSPEMVAAARARGLDARPMDARVLPFQSEFDAVFSNAVLHWILELDQVLGAVHRALKPGGRFVGECGGHGCVAAVATAVSAVAARHGLALTLPWRFRTVDEFDAALQASGLDPVLVQLVPRPTFLASGMRPWLRTFASWAFESLPDSEREQAFAETEDLLRPALCDSRGRWTADYIRLRFAARRT
jgi:SAM-dependent methyltransferase